MKRYKYQALLTLYPVERGGLGAALPCQTRRLVVPSHHHDTHVSKIFSSVVTTADDRPLCPGCVDVPVTMQLNGDDALDYFGPGERFTLWFGTDVGHGVVSRRMFT
jgi:hypothetical protein